MKYLSILSVLLLIGGNFGFTSELSDEAQLDDNMTLQEQKMMAKRQANKDRIEWLKRNAKARAVRKKQLVELKNSDCVGESCDETNIISNNTNCNDREFSIPQGKTILNKKKIYKNKSCDRNISENSTESSSNGKLPILHSQNEVKNRSLRSGFIMSNNNYTDEDEKDEELNNKLPIFHNSNEVKNSNIKDSFILLDEDF